MSALAKSDRSSETAKIPASGGRRGVWGLFAVAAVFVVLLSAVGVPAASAHPPEAKTVCPDGYSLSADETECSKTTAQDHGKASCDSGYDLVSKTRGAAVCEKEVGKPTCARGTGDDCVTTTDHGKATCATGNLKNGVCIGTAVVGSPTCATGNLKNGVCIGTAVVGSPTCATGNLKNGVCIGTADHGRATCANGILRNGSCSRTSTTYYGAPTVCVTGSLSNGRCVTTTTTTTGASYRCGSGVLTTGAFGIPVCRQTANKRCPAGTNHVFGVCYNPTTQAITNPSCPAGYSAVGPVCQRYTVATPYCTSGTLSGGSCKRTTTTDHGRATCANGILRNGSCSRTSTTYYGAPTVCVTGSLSNGRCVSTTDLGPPKKCVTGSLSNGRCVSTTDLGPPKKCSSGSYSSGKCVSTTDLGPPKKCVTGSLSNGRCVSTTDLGPPKKCSSGSYSSGRCVTTTVHGKPTCANGKPQGSKCFDQKNPTCTKGTLSGTNCVTTTTETTSPMNTLNYHETHNCPASHNYTPPLSRIWIVQTVDGPLHVTEEQVKQNPHVIANGELAVWEKQDDTHNCYKPVLPKAKKINITEIFINGYKYVVKGGKFVYNNVEYRITEAGKVVIAGVEHAIDEAGNLIPNWNGVLNSALDAATTLKDASVRAYKFTNNVLEVVLCAPLVGTTAAALAGIYVGTVTANPLAGAFTGFTVSVMIDEACSGWSIADQIEAGIYFVLQDEERLRLKAHEAAEKGKTLGITVCGPSEGLAITEFLSALVADVVKTPWVDLADWTISASHELSCTDTNATPTHTVTRTPDPPPPFRTPTPTPTPTPKPDPNPAAPAAASGLKLAAGDGQIAVSWTASTTAPEAGFGYRLQWKPADKTWDDPAARSVNLAHGSNLATSRTITGLVNGSAYDVRVAAYSSGGVSRWAAAAATPTAPEPPAAASGLLLSPGDKQIAVSWSASATTPEAGFGYRVQWKLTTQAWGDAAVQSTDLDHGSDLATSHTITGLVNGSAYSVRVAAFNANGLSTWITGTATPAKPKTKPKPSLTFDSVSCASSGSGWVISVTWSKTPETLKPDIWANEAKNRGHRGRQTAVAGTSTTFDVPNAGWYQVGMQAKIAGNKKVGDSEAVRCR